MLLLFQGLDEGDFTSRSTVAETVRVVSRCDKTLKYLLFHSYFGIILSPLSASVAGCMYGMRCLEIAFPALCCVAGSWVEVVAARHGCRQWGVQSMGRRRS